MDKNIKGISILESLVCLVIIGIGFHASIAILGINLTLFSMTMIICYLAFFPVWEKETSLTN